MPQVTYIIVQKRHNTKFFPRSDKDADKSGNCKAGTVRFRLLPGVAKKAVGQPCCLQMAGSK